MKENFFLLDIQLFATSKGGGTTKNKKKHPGGKRLGIKKTGGQRTFPGNIILRQRGLEIKNGKNTSRGRDFTIYSEIAGEVHYSKNKRKKIVSVIPY